MNTRNKVIVKLKTRVPKILYTAIYNGDVLGHSDNAKDLGEYFANLYCTEWILDADNKYYTGFGIVSK